MLIDIHAHTWRKSKLESIQEDYTLNKEKELPNPMLWIFESRSLKNRYYLKEIDFIKKNTSVDFLLISTREGVQLSNLQQCHEPIKELVAYAHENGIRVGLHIQPVEGFFNANLFGGDYPDAVDQVQIFPICSPEKAEALTNDYEAVLDDEGYAEFEHRAKWGRVKLMPLYAEILCGYVFDKTAEGTYVKDSLLDITDKIRITESRTDMLKCEVNFGKEQSGKTCFVIIAQYYNYFETTEHKFAVHKKILDDYSDIPLDGFALDEYGFVPLDSSKIDTGIVEPFRARIYSHPSLPL